MCLALSVLHTQLGLHTIVDAELSPICVTQSQNITPVRAKKREKRVGRDKKKSRECHACLGWGWEGVAEEDEEEERKNIYTTYILVCVHNVEELFL